VLDVGKTVDICLPRRINEKAPRVAARRFGLFSESNSLVPGDYFTPATSVEPFTST
jgi:hypothetical protein